MERPPRARRGGPSPGDHGRGLDHEVGVPLDASVVTDSLDTGRLQVSNFPLGVVLTGGGVLLARRPGAGVLQGESDDSALFLAILLSYSGAGGIAVKAQQAEKHPLLQLLDDHKVPLPEGLLDVLDERDLDIVLKDITSTALRPVDEDEVPSEEPGPALDGALLLADPDAALARYKSNGGTDHDLVNGYLSSASFLHLVRTSSQPAMARATLMAMVPALARTMCAEAGVEGVSAMLLAEQAAEARADEAYHRALAGTALDSNDLKRAEMLNMAADRFSRRMMKALEQIHRLRKPRVNVTVKQAGNVNFGSQQVTNGAGGRRAEDKETAGPFRRLESG